MQNRPPDERSELVSVARAAIRRATETILAHEAGARAGTDPEELHKLRVGSRRLRAALATYADLLPPKRLRKSRKRLRRLTRALAPVRDLDVYAELLGAAIARATDPGVRCALEHVAAVLASRRAREHERLRERLDELDLPREARRLEALAAKAAPRDGRAPEDLPARIIEARLGRAFANLAGSLVADDAEALHARRIEVKRLRYALEALAPVVPAEFAGALTDLAKRVQEALGRHHDAVMLARILEEERARSAEAGREALASGLARAVALAEDARRDAFEAYVRVARRALDLLPASVLLPGPAGGPSPEPKGRRGTHGARSPSLRPPDRPQHGRGGEPEERPAPAG